MAKKYAVFFFFYSCFHLYGNLPYTYPPPFSPFLRRPFLIPCHFLPYRQSYPLWECDRSLFSYAVSRLREGTGKLQKTCADTVGHLTESVSNLTVSEKITSRSAIRYARRGLAVTHPSTDLAKSCLNWVVAWHRTPTTHRTLSGEKKKNAVLFVIFFKIINHLVFWRRLLKVTEFHSERRGNWHTSVQCSDFLDQFLYDRNKKLTDLEIKFQGCSCPIWTEWFTIFSSRYTLKTKDVWRRLFLAHNQSCSGRVSVAQRVQHSRALPPFPHFSAKYP